MSMQEAVYYNQVPNEGDVLSNLLEQHQTVSSWNPRLLGSEEDTDAKKVSRGLWHDTHDLPCFLKCITTSTVSQMLCICICKWPMYCLC